MQNGTANAKTAAKIDIARFLTIPLLPASSYAARAATKPTATVKHIGGIKYTTPKKIAIATIAVINRVSILYPPESSVPFLIFNYSAIKLPLIKIRPELIREHKLTVCSLPEKIV